MAKKPKQMEGEVYYPSEQVVAQARLKDWDALAEMADKDLEGFWADEASELEWYKKWDKVLDDSNKPFFKWFVGAQTNIVHNAIDRHLKTHRKNQAGAHLGKRRRQAHRTYSYYAMNREVSAWQTSSKPWASSKRRPRHHLHGTRA
jgi:acetyl-CoA synthetase